jgi:hypothetical protein
MKRTILIAIATALTASIVCVEARSLFKDRARADDEQTAGGWEYLVVQGGTTNLSSSDTGNGSMRKEPGAFSRESFPLEKNLDKLGAKGWELVTVSGPPSDPIYYLKRRK